MTSQRNRGMFLERVINISNKQYLERGLALINKIPTPTTVNKRKGTGRYTEKSIVDFTGVSQGSFIAFDAKETKENRFPFSRLLHHQRTYLNDAHKQGGEAFVLILFVKENELYRLDIKEYETLIETIGRKSIPLSWFRDNKTQVKSKHGVYYDYLSIVGG